MTNCESPAHPSWCDVNRCTWEGRGGAHYSTWITLRPLSNRVVVRAYLYADDCASVPFVMVAAYSPIDHPDDIADNAGDVEDTVGGVVMSADELPGLIDLLSVLLAAAKGRQSRDLGRLHPLEGVQASKVST